jgi:hypothetical protein
MNESRERFHESAHAILDALETGVIECNGKHYEIPARNLRPIPVYSFRGRTFGAGGSPETMPSIGKLGVGMLIIPAKSWKHMDADFNAFRYGGMPADEGEQNIGLFDETVMPMVKIWEPDPFTKLTPLNLHAESLKERKSA